MVLQDHRYKSNKDANCATENLAQMRLGVKAMRIKILLVQYQSDNWTNALSVNVTGTNMFILTWCDNEGCWIAGGPGGSLFRWGVEEFAVNCNTMLDFGRFKDESESRKTLSDRKRNVDAVYFLPFIKIYFHRHRLCSIKTNSI